MQTDSSTITATPTSKSEAETLSGQSPWATSFSERLIPCPECGITTDEGTCHNNRCRVGFRNIQVELGREVPEDWLMASFPDEGPCLEEQAPSSTGEETRICSWCGEPWPYEFDACMEAHCRIGAENLAWEIADRQYHSRW